jgi:hypothetical protein
MITIIIFSSNRFDFLSQLIRDIKKCNSKIRSQIILVSYNETKTNINKIKNITNENYFNYYIEKNDLSFSKKLEKYIKKVKTKFFWIIGDDDRVKYNSIKEINTILKKNNENISGFTLNYDYEKKIKKNISNNRKKKCELKNFDIIKDIHKLGMLSAQVYKTKEFIRFKNPNKRYFNEAYYHLGILIYLLFSKKNWKYLDKKLLIYRYGIINYKKKLSYLNRLDDEFKGYFEPIKYYAKENYLSIFKTIFYTNIVSWTILNTKMNGKIKTFQIIFKNLNFFPFNIQYLLILLFILILPLNFLNLLKRLKI